MLRSIKKLFFLGIMLTFSLLVIIYPARSVEAAGEAVALCINVVIPSLFVFMVISGVLVRLGFSNIIAHPLEKVMRRLFCVSGQGAICFVLGIMSGYPIGAICVRDMLMENRLSLSDAKKLLGFCNNSGPLFILGAVGAVMYQNTAVGTALYVIHVLSSILTGMIIGRFKKDMGEERRRRYSALSPPLADCFTAGVKSALSSMAMVCAFTVVFAVVIELFLKPIGADTLFGAFFEISTGLKSISLSDLSFNTKLILTAFFLGFGGLGVHMQVAAVIQNTELRLWGYLFSKLLQGVISAVLMTAALFFFADKLTGPVVSYYMYAGDPDLMKLLLDTVFYVACSIVIIYLIALICRRRK